jgi:hypothetical protein
MSTKTESIGIAKNSELVRSQSRTALRRILRQRRLDTRHGSIGAGKHRLQYRSGPRLKSIRLRQSAYLNNLIKQDHRVWIGTEILTPPKRSAKPWLSDKNGNSVGSRSPPMVTLSTL